MSSFQPLYIRNKYDNTWADQAMCSGGFAVPPQIRENIRKSKIKKFNAKLKSLNQQRSDPNLLQFEIDLIEEMIAELKKDKDILCEPSMEEVKDRIFFPERGRSLVYAKKICERCPVKEHCLESSLVNRERYGIWGSASHRDRRRIFSMRKLISVEIKAAYGYTGPDYNEFDDLDDEGLY